MVRPLSLPGPMHPNTARLMISVNPTCLALWAGRCAVWRGATFGSSTSTSGALRGALGGDAEEWTQDCRAVALAAIGAMVDRNGGPARVERPARLTTTSQTNSIAAGHATDDGI
jgi:hypothetical protein